MEQTLYYSRISGYGVYEVVSGEHSVPGIGACIQMQHVDTKVEFYAVRQEGGEMFYDRIIEMIELRIPDRQWVWPCDLVENTTGDCYLLFAPDAYPQYQPIANIAQAQRGLDDPTVLKAISWMLIRLDILWSSGFITANFDLHDFYYDLQRDEGYIAFSALTASKLAEALPGEDAPAYSTRPISRIAKCEGMVDPYGFSEEHEQYLFDNDSFLIATAAALFYLLVGRMPYDGSLQDDDRYDMVQNPGRFWGHAYAYRPYFIMDEQDSKRNQVGEYPEELVQMARYEKLSPKLKEMFCRNLRYDSVMREEGVNFATPREWLTALAEWYADYQKREG